MDDELHGAVWSLDPETRAALRLDRVRRLMRDQDYVEAIVEVEELLDEEPDNVDGLFLLGEALLEVGEASIALEAYAHHVALTGGDARSLLGLAITRYDTCDLAGAVEAAREAARLDPSVAEAHWYLGLALERLTHEANPDAGPGAEAITAFSAARSLDPRSYPFPLTLDQEAWDDALAEALEALHPTLQAFWHGVDMRFEEWPDLAELRRHDPPVPPSVALMYEGEHPDEREPEDGDDEPVDPWQHRPTALRLFRRNLARSQDLEELIEAVASGLESEALDWLGLADLSELDADELA